MSDGKTDATCCVVNARLYINVSLLFRNIVWQTRERIIKKEKPPLKELIRTFWYMFVKPTLSRAGTLIHETDQYAQLVDTIVFMVKGWRLMEYKDIGFRDDKKSNRKVGYNVNIILFSEKTGHQDFLEEIYEQYQVSILKNTRVIDLMHPDMLGPDEVKLSRYRIPKTGGMAAKNQAWLKNVHKRDYQNQKYLEEETKRGEKILYDTVFKGFSEPSYIC